MSANPVPIMVCDYCDEAIARPSTPGPAGYATRLVDGATTFACYACCAWLAIMDMRNGVDPGLYATGNAVTTWPGTLSLYVIRRIDGRHNMCGRKTTIHFEGPDGSTWTGTEYHGPASGNVLRSVRPLHGKRFTHGRRR